MRLHHIGWVVRNLEDTAGRMKDLLGLDPIGSPITDPLQGVRLLFLSTGANSDIELIEPLDQTSPVSTFLARGGGLHHLCYEVDDLDSSLAEMRKKGCAITSPPKPAVAFEGRRVSFLVTRERDVIELLERKASPS